MSYLLYKYFKTTNKGSINKSVLFFILVFFAVIETIYVIDYQAQHSSLSVGRKK